MSEFSAVDGRSPLAVAALAVWLGLALTTSAIGLLASAPVPPPAIAFGLVAAVLLLLLISPRARSEARSLGTSTLVGIHVVRLFAGGYFLFLYQREALPRDFAIPAGYGDIMVAAGAILVLWLCVPVDTARRRHALLLWNAVGLVDILMVLGNGIRLSRTDPGFLEQFTRLPLALLSTFVVPIVIVSHLLIFAWHSRAAEPGPQPAALPRAKQ